MCTKKHWVAISLLALLATPAQAQSVMHQEVNINRISSGGVLAACSVVFDILYRDFVYRQGVPSLASGSLSFYLQPNRGFASVKVVGQDLSAAAEQLGFFQVTNAFVEVNGTAYLIDRKSQCERPTGFCAGYGYAKAMDLLKSAMPTFAIGFNRKAKGMDIRLPVTLEQPQLAEMAACLDALIQQVQRSMN